MPSGRMGIFMRILVAEDEKILNSMITKTLTNEGYSVDSCYNGEDALHFLKMGEFDLSGHHDAKAQRHRRSKGNESRS